MSRTVATALDAVEVAYILLPEEEAYEDWCEFVNDIRYAIKDQYPSFEHIERSSEREVQDILENEHCIVSISEYSGLIAVSIRENEEHYGGLSRAWTQANAENIKRLIEGAFGGLRKVATFSNGEAVYEQI